MPHLQIPSDEGTLAACTGLADVRKAGGDQQGLEHLQQITFTVYDLPPNNSMRLLDGTISLTKFVCPQSSHASYITLNPNDVVTVVMNSNRFPVMIYNHTLKLAAYQKTDFYKKAFQVQDFLKSNIVMIAIAIIFCPALPIILFIALSTYGNGTVRKNKDQECERLTAWILQNVNVYPQPVQANMHLSI
jgi:hypothetical protein